VRQAFHFGVHGARQVAAKWRVPLLALVLCAATAGCRHRMPVLHVPVAEDMTLEDAHVSDDATTIESMPLPEYGPLPTTPAVPPVQKRRPPAAREDTQPAVAPAETAPPVDLGIGSLSTGADATPQVHVQTQEMISSIMRRIGRLPAHTVETQRSNVSRVRNFLAQAQQALNTGDVDGARNLAAKAGVLMDDVEKH
jgi:hypothetical protein